MRASFCGKPSARPPLATALVAVLLAFGCGAETEEPLGNDDTKTTDAPLAPPFTLQTLEGDSVSLLDHCGDVVVVTFWATWCEPCRAEMPLFNELRRKFAPQGFEVLGIAMDDSPREVVPQYVEELGLEFPILIVTPDVARQYRIFGLPTTYILTRDGRVGDVLIGEQTKEVFEPLIARHL